VAAHRHGISRRLGYGACGLGPASGAPREESPPGSDPSEPDRRLWPTILKHPSVALREALVVASIVMIINQSALDNSWARGRLQKIGVEVSQPAPLLAVVNTFRLLQGWRMFAPEPPYEDGRMVVDARTMDGRIVDPLTGQEPDFDPHTDVGWGHTQLWCDYHLKMYFSRYAAYRQFLKSYLLSWHQRTGHPEDRLVAFDVWWVRDKSPPPGQTRGEPLEPARLLSHGRVEDSGADPWVERARENAPAGGGGS
jgi:hypothetical protein